MIDDTSTTAVYNKPEIVTQGIVAVALSTEHSQFGFDDMCRLFYYVVGNGSAEECRGANAPPIYVDRHSHPNLSCFYWSTMGVHVTHALPTYGESLLALLQHNWCNLFVRTQCTWQCTWQCTCQCMIRCTSAMHADWKNQWCFSYGEDRIGLL